MSFKDYYFFVISSLILLSCKQNSSSEESVVGNNDSIESTEYLAGDTIATQKEHFNIDSFRLLKEQAADQALKEKVETAQIVKKEKSIEKKKKPVKKLYPSIEFEQEVYEIGDITEGDVIDQDFEFTNIGKSPLNIKKAEGTCGCTIPSYPFLSIEPGGTGNIGVTYNSVGKSGLQEPEILVYSDAKNAPISKLKLVLNVLDKTEQETTDSLKLN